MRGQACSQRHPPEQFRMPPTLHTLLRSSPTRTHIRATSISTQSMKAMPQQHGLLMSGLQKSSHAIMAFDTQRSTHTASYSTFTTQPPTTIHTDGSVLPVGAGAAAYVEFPGAPALVAKLHLGVYPEYTSTDAEFWGVIVALRIITKVLSLGFSGRIFRLGIDHLGVIACLSANLSSPARPNSTAALMQEYARRINKAYPNVQLQVYHTRSHSGIHGNVKADRAAKDAARGETMAKLVEEL
ncbi:hypothetical protein BC835DRAFT_88539 [Cytidiella melzeri]|nr:hypothetical protein BC835DRAFT_88539 [Cytidiella melzeri]